MSKYALAASVLALAASAGGLAARENVQIAGSSTVLPYASIVAEVFSENSGFPTPVVESGGSSAGLKKFCEGIGENQIDIANSSRPIRPAEREACAANGVGDILEVRFGYDGIVFASDIGGPSFAFTPEHWFRALAAEVPVDGKLAANPFKLWSELDPALPAQEITAFVPGTKHGTREVFEEKVMLAGCKAAGADKLAEAERGAEAVQKLCTTLRRDGRAVDIDGDYTETLARIQTKKTAIGIFGLSFYKNNTDKLKVATISGVSPSVETIASGDYPVSRPLFFYVKKAHIGLIPGLKEFIELFVSDEMAGPDGPLADYGLVSDPDLSAIQQAVALETVMN